MKTLLRAALIGVLVLPAAQVGAEDLPPDKLARIELGKCYSECALRGYVSGQFLIQLGLSLPASPSLTQTFYSCIAVQEHVRLMDACYSGCYDIEQAYEVKISSARARYLSFLRMQREPLREAGLWRSYSNSPNYYDVSSPAFAQACNQYIRGNTLSQEVIKDEMLTHDASKAMPRADEWEIPVDGAEASLLDFGNKAMMGNKALLEEALDLD